MKRYLLDTGIAGLYIDRKRGVYERAREEVTRGNRIGIGTPVLAELAYRAEGSPKRDRNMQRLHLALATWKLWLVTQEVALEYGRIAIELKRLDRIIGQNDMMIAAIARTIGNGVVVTMDNERKKRGQVRFPLRPSLFLADRPDAATIPAPMPRRLPVASPPRQTERPAALSGVASRAAVQGLCS